MNIEKFKEELEQIGFKVWNTGGNCLAYGYLISYTSSLNKGNVEIEILVTEVDGPGIDFDEQGVLVGIGEDDNVQQFKQLDEAIKYIKDNIDYYEEK